MMLKTTRKDDLLSAINKVKVFCFNSQNHKELKDIYEDLAIIETRLEHYLEQ